MKKGLVTIVFGLFITASANAAVVDVYDGDYNVYNPADTYLIHGWISETLFTFGFGFTDPSHRFELNLTAPDGMPGKLEFAFTSGPYATGIGGGGGYLLEGETFSGVMSGGPTASPDNVADFWVTLANFSIPASDPIYFGPGDGTGVSTSLVPIPPALWLFGSGLLGLFGVARRRAAC